MPFKVPRITPTIAPAAPPSILDPTRITPELAGAGVGRQVAATGVQLQQIQARYAAAQRRETAQIQSQKKRDFQLELSTVYKEDATPYFETTAAGTEYQTKYGPTLSKMKDRGQQAFENLGGDDETTDWAKSYLERWERVNTVEFDKHFRGTETKREIATQNATVTDLAGRMQQEFVGIGATFQYGEAMERGIVEFWQDPEQDRNLTDEQVELLKREQIGPALLAKARQFFKSGNHLDAREILDDENLGVYIDGDDRNTLREAIDADEFTGNIQDESYRIMAKAEGQSNFLYDAEWLNKIRKAIHDHPGYDAAEEDAITKRTEELFAERSGEKRERNVNETNLAIEAIRGGGNRHAGEAVVRGISNVEGRLTAAAALDQLYPKATRGGKDSVSKDLTNDDYTYLNQIYTLINIGRRDTTGRIKESIRDANDLVQHLDSRQAGPEVLKKAWKYFQDPPDEPIDSWIDQTLKAYDIKMSDGKKGLLMDNILLFIDPTKPVSRQAVKEAVLDLASTEGDVIVANEAEEVTRLEAMEEGQEALFLERISDETLREAKIAMRQLGQDPDPAYEEKYGRTDILERLFLKRNRGELGTRADAVRRIGLRTVQRLAGTIGRPGTPHTPPIPPSGYQGAAVQRAVEGNQQRIILRISASMGDPETVHGHLVGKEAMRRTLEDTAAEGEYPAWLTNAYQEVPGMLEQEEAILDTMTGDARTAYILWAGQNYLELAAQY